MLWYGLVLNHGSGLCSLKTSSGRSTFLYPYWEAASCQRTRTVKTHVWREGVLWFICFFGLLFYVRPIQISLNFFKVTKHEHDPWFRPQSRLSGTKEFKIGVTAQGLIYSWYEQLFSVRGNLHVENVTAQRQWKLDGWDLIGLPLLCRGSRSCCLFEKAGFAFSMSILNHCWSGALLHVKCWGFSVKPFYPNGNQFYSHLFANLDFFSFSVYIAAITVKSGLYIPEPSADWNGEEQ